MLKKLFKKVISLSGYEIRRSEMVEKPPVDKFSVKEENADLWLKKFNIQSILDIGANDGGFARKVRVVFPEAHIYSFEPIPEVFTQLQENFKTDPSFTAYNYALGEKEEESKIYLNEFSPSSSMLKMGDEHKKHFDFAKKEIPVTIKVKVLDTIFPSLNVKTPLLIKVDVQGFEEYVIKGGKVTFSKASLVIIEVSYKELYDGQPLFHAIYEKLYSMGFLYGGNYEQLISPEDGSILQADAIFINRS